MDYHVPVLPDEVEKFLQVRPDGIYFDGTLGGGGHAEAVLKKLKSGRLIASDLDSDAIGYAGKRLAPYADKLTIVNDNFKNALEILKAQGIDGIDGALLDLGISSHQIDEGSRGFSYMKDAALDMRMNQSAALTAYDVINGYAEGKLKEIFFKYGEEPFAKRIAVNIAKRRESEPIKTTSELNEIIRASVPARVAAISGHPSKKVFQAVRIAVNGEIEGLENAVRGLVSALKGSGRIVVISFHSLEDRIIKNVFRELATDCLCDKKMPICTCGHKAELKILTTRPVTASEAELERNPRAGSAKLRAAEKI